MSDQGNIALTGASGHVGYVIHRKLKAAGHPHRLFFRSDPPAYIDWPDRVIGHLSDRDTLLRLCRGCQTVIHSAAMVWPRVGANPEVQRVNVEYTKQLYEAAVEAGVQHFIFISSIHSMKMSKDGQRTDESAALVEDRTLSYDYSKASAERFLESRKELTLTIVNPTAIIGPGDHYFHGFNQFFRKLSHRRMPLNVTGGFDIVDVRDVADAIIYAAVNGVPGKFILSGGYQSMTALADRYGKVNGLNVPQYALPAFFMRIMAWCVRMVEFFYPGVFALNTYSVNTLLEGDHNISSEKAREALGFSNRPLDEVMEDICQWIQSAETNAAYG